MTQFQVRSGPLAHLLLVAAAGFSPLACSSAPDPRAIEGAIGAALVQAEAQDSARLFRFVDQRARHAMASIQQDRAAAARLVRASYPPAARAQVLASLGAAAEARSAAEVFAQRCDPACMRGLSGLLRAPASVERTGTNGDDAVVSTVHGATLRLHRGNDGWWGIVWHTDELSRERDRAAHDLEQIRANAAVYDRRRALGDPW